MPPTRSVDSLSAVERELWNQVVRLWELSRTRDRAHIVALIHPQYVGWDISAELPHDKDAALASVTDNPPVLRDYSLLPHSVRVYDQRVGVVHYSYRATVASPDAVPLTVAGKWTEVYLRVTNEWTMIAVSGMPTPSTGASAVCHPDPVDATLRQACGEVLLRRPGVSHGRHRRT